MKSLNGRRVFVVTDDAGRGEAQFFLLHLLRQLREDGATIDLFTWTGGGLLDEYARVATVRDLDDLNRWLLARACERLRLRRVGQALKGLRLRWWLRRTADADVGYLSGAEAARICGFLPQGVPPLVTHLHGTTAFPEELPSDSKATIIERTARFVVSSGEAQEDLVVGEGVPEDRVQRQDYLLLVDALALSSDSPPTRSELGIPDDAVVVAGAGTADWWAAPDPFVLMAWDVRQRADGADPWFLWVGPESGERELWPLHHDIANAGIDSRVVVLDSPTSIDALAVADVFVLATREDRHVRLTIEAAKRALPIVCTEGVGDVLGEAPTVVPYLDGDALAGVVTDLVLDDGARRTLGERAAAAAALVHDTESGVAEVVAIIESVMDR